jgi:hypothetical protein
VKPSDAPTLEPSHPLAPKVETRFNVKSESDEYAPRYVDVPARQRGVRAGRRNLLWGIALLCAALLLLGFAVLIGTGARAVLWPIVSMITFTALWVLARLRLFHQRNGVFFALSIVALLGSALAISEYGFERLAGARPVGPLPNVATSDSGEVASARERTEPPLLSEALHLMPPDPSEGSRVKILQDSQVTVARKNYRVQAGETFPLDNAKDGFVTFVAGEFSAKVPQADVQILGPQRALAGSKATKNSAHAGLSASEKEHERDPADVEIERRARAEALRRFPALASQGSPENQEFLTAYNQLKEKHSAMLDDPEWPIRLAESLAQQSQWEEAPETANATESEVVGRGAPPPVTSGDEVVGRGSTPTTSVANANAHRPPLQSDRGSPSPAPVANDAPSRDTPPPPPPTPR